MDVYLTWGSSINLLSYSLYLKLGLGELQPINATLHLADQSIKLPKGVVEDFLTKVDEFYFPTDFIVLDMEPMVKIELK